MKPCLPKCHQNAETEGINEMPIREYECKDCQLKFETIDLGTDSEKPGCPRCQSENVERKFSLFSSSHVEGASCNITRGFG